MARTIRSSLRWAAALCFVLALACLVDSASALETQVQWERNETGQYVTTAVVPKGSSVYLNLVRRGRCSTVHVEAATFLPGSTEELIPEYDWDRGSKRYVLKRDMKVTIANNSIFGTDPVKIIANGSSHRFQYGSGKVLDVIIALPAAAE